MEILDLKVDWNVGFENDPQVQIRVDHIPALSEMRFIKRGSLYFAELDDYVMFFSYSKPDRGFGGQRFTVTMQDGSTETLIGPWSSSSWAMNAAGFTPCMEVSMTTEPKVMQDGYTFMAGAVTVRAISTALPKFRHGGCRIVERKIHGAVAYTVSPFRLGENARELAKLATPEPQPPRDIHGAEMSSEQELVVNS